MSELYYINLEQISFHDGSGWTLSEDHTRYTYCNHKESTKPYFDKSSFSRPAKYEYIFHSGPYQTVEEAIEKVSTLNV